VIRSVWWAGLLALAVAVVIGSLVLVDRGGRADPLEERAGELRQEIRALRDRVDACLARQDRLAARFESVMERTEDLRERVAAFEAMDPEGVPAEQYGAYLEAFDEYNDAIPEWEELGETLREKAGRCRTLTEAHNERLEHLQGLLVEGFAPPAPPS
jgi:chromosome segregation ATPase